MQIMRIMNVAASLLVCVVALATIPFQDEAAKNSAAAEQPQKEDAMQLGNFSVSLAVKDINASQAFYEKLDFKPIGGNVRQKWLIMQNGTTTIGLFQGMFEKNLMTFNPGWNHKSETLPEFQDVRELQTLLKERGIAFATEADANTDGPASFVITDPDGNPILVDQHVAKPK